MFCPSCGAQIEVDRRVAHLVVCEYCDSTLILDADAARVAGKMAALKPPAGLFYLGAEGEVRGQRFRVLGRVRYGYSAGFWDEWFLAFQDGTQAWVSEDEDSLALETCLELTRAPVSYEQARPGDYLDIGDGSYHIDERDVATCEGGEGQLPFVIVPGEEVPFLDCSQGKWFATLEYDEDGAKLFRGTRLREHEVTLDVSREDAGIGADFVAQGVGRERVVVGQGRTLSVKCESCGAPLEVPEGADERFDCTSCGRLVDLTHPRVDCPGCQAQMPLRGGDATESVVCTGCGSQLDLSQDVPAIVSNLQAMKKVAAPVKLGMSGTLRGERYTVIGHLRTRQSDAWGTYISDEFLLQPRKGRYRWLILEDGHFSLGEELDDRPTDAGNPKLLSRHGKFRYDGKSWRVYEACPGGVKVVYVNGELPWVAKVGDSTGFMDAVHEPFLLSAEWNRTEVEWFRAEYLPKDEVCEAFGISPHRISPRGVAPHQPFEISRFRREARWWMAAFCALFFYLFLNSYSRGAMAGETWMEPTLLNQEGLSETFHIDRGGVIIEVDTYANVDNSWIYLDLAVVDDQDRALVEFSSDLSYYHGYSGGESWSEGSQNDTALFLLDEPGDYRILAAGQAGSGNVGTHPVQRRVRVRVIEGVELARWYLLGLLFCSSWVLFEMLAYFSHYNSKWGEEED